MTRLWPKTLAAQLIVSLLLALIAAQVIALAIFADERRMAIATAKREQVLSRTASIVRVLRETPPAMHEQVLAAASTRRLSFSLDGASTVAPGLGNADNPLARSLASVLGLSEGNAVLVDVSESGYWPWERYRGANRAGSDEDDERDDDDDDDDDERAERHHDDLELMDRHGAGWRRDTPILSLRVSIDMAAAGGAATAGGRWLNAESRVFPGAFGWAWWTLTTLGVTVVAISLVTFLIVRRITRPLARLATASDALGRGEEVAPLDETGPVEVRSTTAAFNRMQDRLHRFVADRTKMLAAISHDLRTPLTSLRLRAEFIEDAETRQKVLETLDEMQRMIEATLAFAREDAAHEETRAVDLSALVESLVDDAADRGHAVTFTGPGKLALRCRPLALRRALRNLIENAVTYGEHANVTLEADEATHRIVVEDDGPGIPEADRERVFEPFVRLEESRSRETGGIGLGMAIARTIVHAHGGRIDLADRPQGGLKVTVTLPAVDGGGA